MIKLTIEMDGKVVQQVEGESAQGVVINPKDGHGGNAMTFAAGSGSLHEIITGMATSCGSVINQLVDGNVAEKLMVSELFIGKFAEGLTGHGVETLKVQTEISRPENNRGGVPEESSGVEREGSNHGENCDQ